MSTQPRTDDEDASPSCIWCGSSFEPGDAAYGVHIAGLDSSRLDCPHQDLQKIVEADREQRDQDLFRVSF
jgi:hypothetical protein